MNGRWMDGWMDGCTGRWMDGQVDGWISGDVEEEGTEF
jgi:hypothetical protein